jgi:hypothetical protein
VISALSQVFHFSQDDKANTLGQNCPLRCEMVNLLHRMGCDDTPPVRACSPELGISTFGCLQRILVERSFDGPREDFEFDLGFEFEFILLLAGLDRKFMLVPRSDAVLAFGGLYARMLVFSGLRLTGPVRVA